MEQKLEDLAKRISKMQEEMITRKHHEVIVAGLSQTLAELNEIKKTLDTLKNKNHVN